MMKGNRQMQKAKVFVLLGMTFLVTAVTFNNCGKVEFQNVPEVDTKGLSSGLNDAIVPDSAADGGSSIAPSSLTGSDTSMLPEVEPVVVPVTAEEIQQIVSVVPPEELAVIRPVTDLQDPNNEFLLDVYACGDGGVLICHFPATVVGGEVCIGQSAVKTHYDHVRSYDNGAGPKTIADYLGPCRVAL
jgi:hypothetical protein